MKVVSLLILTVNLVLNIGVMVCAMILEIHEVWACMSIPFLLASFASLFGVARANIVALHFFLAIEIMNLIPLCLVAVVTVRLWIVLILFQVKSCLIAYIVTIYQAMQVKTTVTSHPGQGFEMLEDVP